MNRIDTDRLRDQFPIHELAAQDTRLVKTGREWKGCCPLHSESTPSFTIYVEDGYQKFKCFGCKEHGDVLDYVIKTGRAHDLPSAARYLDGDLDSRDAAPATPRQRPVEVDPYEGIERLDQRDLAAGTEIQLFNPKSGKTFAMTPTLVHPYWSHQGELLGYVVRWYVDGKKQTPFIAWSRRLDGTEGWTMSKLDEPRPIYGLERASPRAQLFVFEGEKKPDMFTALKLKGTSGVGFAYGSTAWRKTDWTPLAGRRVVLWPDIDNAGLNAMLGTKDEPGLAHHLLDEIGVRELKVVKPRHGAKRGWNVDDAIDEGWDADTVAGYIREQLLEPEDAERLARLRVAAKEERRKNDDPVEQLKPTAQILPLKATSFRAPAMPQGDQLPTPSMWRSDIVLTDKGGIAKGDPWNHEKFLRYFPDFWKAFSFNELSQQVSWVRPAPWDEMADWKPRALTPEDVTRIQGWASRHGDLSIKREQVVYTLEMIAKEKGSAFHPARSYFRSLQWDGVKRLDTVLIDFLGAKDTPFNRIVFRKWLISAIARSFQPGCKVDTMLILEGTQGMLKSTFFGTLAEAIGPDMFTDGLKNLSNKDAIINSLGKIIIEMSELEGLSKASTGEIKQFLSSRVDAIRLPYASTTSSIPRQFVIGGTVNPNGTGYLKDETGNRRFWPVGCSRKLDVEALQAVVHQIWAEGVVAYDAGEKWWLTDEEEVEAKAVQASRMQIDEWEDILAVWLAQHPEDPRDGHDPAVLYTQLSVTADKRDGRTSARLQHLMVKLGYEVRRPRVAGVQVRRWFKRGSEGEA